MLVCPAFSRAGNNFLFVVAHLLDQALVSRLFVRRCPQDHLGKHGGEINSLRRQKVN